CQEDPGHQGCPRADRPGPQGSQGSRGWSTTGDQDRREQGRSCAGQSQARSRRSGGRGQVTGRTATAISSSSRQTPTRLLRTSLIANVIRLSSNNNAVPTSRDFSGTPRLGVRGTSGFSPVRG